MKVVSKSLIAIFVLSICLNIYFVKADAKTVNYVSDNRVVRLYNESSLTSGYLSGDNHLKLLSMVYMDWLKNGKVENCASLYSDSFKKLINVDIIKKMSEAFNSLTITRLNKVTSNKNAVYNNVILNYTSQSVGEIEVTISFNNRNQIDEFRLTPVEKGSYKEPSYDEHNYIEKEVSFGKDGWKLPGTLTLPKGDGPFPVLVLVHGSGPNDRDETAYSTKCFRDIAVGLAAKNIAVLRYDKRTKVYNTKSSLEKKFTVKEETVDDAIEAVNYVSTLKDIDKTRIFVLGHSQGGYLMPRILKADTGNRINGAVIMSGPVRSIEALMLEQTEYLSKIGMSSAAVNEFYKSQFQILDDKSFSPDNPPSSFVLGMPYWWADLKNYDPVKDISSEKRPVLILQGQRDYQVSADKDFKVWKDEFVGKSNFSFILYPKLNHLYTEGEGVLSTPAEYFVPANVPHYVIEDLAKWIGNIGK